MDPEKVVQVTKLIGMHETILAFPKGYDTELGETGFALSGGQRQRIAICRALYGTPKFVVMDEPNANLDEVGESALAHAITYLKSQGSSVIITTHRPRLVGVADNLLVLRNGQQVGFGPADEMINAVRNLQVVPGSKTDDPNGEAEDLVMREATNDAPIATESTRTQTVFTETAVTEPAITEPASPKTPAFESAAQSENVVDEELPQAAHSAQETLSPQATPPVNVGNAAGDAIGNAAGDGSDTREAHPPAQQEGAVATPKPPPASHSGEGQS